MAFNLERRQRGNVIAFFENCKRLLWSERNELFCTYIRQVKEVRRLKFHPHVTATDIFLQILGKARLACCWQRFLWESPAFWEHVRWGCWNKWLKTAAQTVNSRCLLWLLLGLQDTGWNRKGNWNVSIATKKWLGNNNSELTAQDVLFPTLQYKTFLQTSAYKAPGPVTVLDTEA